jgi:hypothetical protein
MKNSIRFRRFVIVVARVTTSFIPPAVYVENPGGSMSQVVKLLTGIPAPAEAFNGFQAVVGVLPTVIPAFVYGFEVGSTAFPIESLM